MGLLSRGMLVLFIFSAIVRWGGGLENDWIMTAITIGSAVLFMALGAHEDNP